MGGYAAFIWPAFALTALILVGLAVSSLRDLRAQQKTLRDLEAESPGRRRRAATKEDRQ